MSLIIIPSGYTSAEEKCLAETVGTGNEGNTEYYNDCIRSERAALGAVNSFLCLLIIFVILGFAIFVIRDQRDHK